MFVFKSSEEMAFLWLCYLGEGGVKYEVLKANLGMTKKDKSPLSFSGQRQCKKKPDYNSELPVPIYSGSKS